MTDRKQKARYSIPLPIPRDRRFDSIFNKIIRIELSINNEINNYNNNESITNIEDEIINIKNKVDTLKKSELVDKQDIKEEIEEIDNQVKKLENQINEITNPKNINNNITLDKKISKKTNLTQSFLTKKNIFNISLFVSSFIVTGITILLIALFAQIGMGQVLSNIGAQIKDDNFKWLEQALTWIGDFTHQNKAVTTIIGGSITGATTMIPASTIAISSHYYTKKISSPKNTISIIPESS
jgi:seryl-tRNA synthetase